MELRLDPATRHALVDRRDRLRSALGSGPALPEIADLLSRVDAALGRWDAGRFGLCEVCGDPVEEDRLRADPLIRFCVDQPLWPGANYLVVSVVEGRARAASQHAWDAGRRDFDARPVRLPCDDVSSGTRAVTCRDTLPGAGAR